MKWSGGDRTNPVVHKIASAILDARSAPEGRGAKRRVKSSHGSTPHERSIAATSIPTPTIEGDRGSQNRTAIWTREARPKGEGQSDESNPVTARRPTKDQSQPPQYPHQPSRAIGVHKIAQRFWTRVARPKSEERSDEPLPVTTQRSPKTLRRRSALAPSNEELSTNAHFRPPSHKLQAKPRRAHWGAHVETSTLANAPIRPRVPNARACVYQKPWRARRTKYSLPTIDFRRNR